MTAFNSKEGGFYLTTVGRVQTPTLSIVVEREEKIKQLRRARLLGSARRVRVRRRHLRRPLVRPEVQEGRERPGKARRAPVEQGRGRRDRRRLPRQAGHRHRRIEADHVDGAGAVRPDQPAARSQRPLRLLGQEHAGPGAGAVRKAQGADLPAYRFAPPAGRLHRHGQGNAGRAGREQQLPPVRQADHRRAAGSSRTSAFSTTPRSRITSRSSRPRSAPKNLSEPEQKLYDLVTRRFLAVFFPAGRIPGHDALHRSRRATSSRPKARS